MPQLAGERGAVGAIARSWRVPVVTPELLHSTPGALYVPDVPSCQGDFETVCVFGSRHLCENGDRLTTTEEAMHEPARAQAGGRKRRRISRAGHARAHAYSNARVRRST